MEDNKSRVYVLPDEDGRILRLEGEYSLPSDLTGWILIEEGKPCDRRNLAQSHYFPDGIYTMDGIPKYKLVNGQPQERTQEELEADRADREVPERAPTLESRVDTLEQSAEETREALELILQGVTQ